MVAPADDVAREDCGLFGYGSEADLLFTYTIVMQTETDATLQAKGTGCAIAFCATPRDYRVDASQPTQGTLVLDRAECSTGHLA